MTVCAHLRLALGFGQTRQASCGTVGYYPSECFYQDTAAEPSTDVFSVGVMLAIIVQQHDKRDSNVFASKVRLCLKILQVAMSSLPHRPSAFYEENRR